MKALLLSHLQVRKLRPRVQSSEHSALVQDCTGAGGGGARSGCRGHTANFSAHPKELGMLPSPSYLEMPAKAQMFSVRLPSLSTRHEGPPGPPGHASHAAGTVETTQESEGEREAVPSPPVPSPRHHRRSMTLCLLTKPPLPHRPPQKTHPHTSAPPHTLTPTRQLKHIHSCASPRHVDLNTHSHT